MADNNDSIKYLADLILRTQKTVFFTGAGASTESGIPDFRSPGGIWSRFDPDDFTLDQFLRSHESRKKQWQFLLGTSSIRVARPNASHLAIAELERMGRVDCIITQNIDGLHQKAGSNPDRVYELHGNLAWVRCLKCRQRYQTDWVIERNDGLKEVPDCEYCGGILKPEVIFFGEMLPKKTLESAAYRSCHCELFIVIGSSLVVYPAALMPEYAKASGAKLVIINMAKTPCDGWADLVINGQAGDTMAKVMGEIRVSMEDRC
ncbi:MAG TPA: Sir2 family NAD-dependent protein deacetylase [Syntrophales bacterium]|nr:Sir2 family NAD-dependent protein deacetylase [Syntrophales bacterium]HPX56852.1 Sir2 family NAD-dependent protein deacetylase [Syntrophales bacterium]HQA82617.1 Sir2 family NAD-dependent protein deacetylase [Syntrophales bacterium]